MVETGVDTGTFLGSIKVASSGGTTEFSQIQAAEGNTLTISYIDEVNTTSSSISVTDAALVGAAVTPTPSPTPSPTPTPGVTPVVTPSPTPSPAPGAITGSVVSSILGQPVSGATVSTDTGGYTATTGPDGSYTIADVAAGDYTLTATATGFESSSQSVTVTAGAATTANFDLVPSVPGTPTPTVGPTPTPPECDTVDSVDASPSKLSIKRKASEVVTVTVTCEDGTPLEGQTVTAKVNAAGKRRVSLSSSSATTDANGEATFTITAKKKTGNAKVTFTSGGKKDTVTVKVRK